MKTSQDSPINEVITDELPYRPKDGDIGGVDGFIDPTDV